MNKNCKVETLIGIVDNNNLMKFGETKLHINTVGWDNESYRTFRFDGGSENVYLSLTGTLKFNDNSTSKTITPEMTKSVILKVGGEGVMSIRSKYNLTELTMPAVVLSGGVYKSIVSDAEGLDYMRNLEIIRCSIPISVDVLQKSSKLTTINKSSIIGDIAQLPATTVFVWGDNNHNVTWKSERPASSEILGMIANLGSYVDDMLINQAKCSHDSLRSSEALRIEVTGTRTSASDTAVATLKGLGFTIVVNGETL